MKLRKVSCEVCGKRFYPDGWGAAKRCSDECRRVTLPQRMHCGATVEECEAVAPTSKRCVECTRRIV